MTSVYSSFEGLALGPNSAGAFDITFTNPGADNCFSVVLTDDTTITSGYIQAFYASMTITGSKTGGNATQPNAFAADIFLGGTITCEVTGVYVYIAESGTAVLTDSIVDGFSVYFASIGSAAAYRSGFHAFSEEATAYNATGVDAGLLVESAGAAGTWGAMIGGMGVTPPQYFLHYKEQPGEERMFSTGAVANVAASGFWLKCRVYNTNYWIALHASCTS